MSEGPQGGERDPNHHNPDIYRDPPPPVSDSVAEHRKKKLETKQSQKENMDKMSKPMCFTNFINKRYYVILLIIFVIVVITMTLTVTREYMKTTEEGGSSYMAKNNVRAKVFLGMTTAIDEIESSNQDKSTPLQSQEIIAWNCMLQFKVSKNIFTRDYLDKIRKLELEFRAIKNFEEFCKLDSTGKCEVMESPVNFFDNKTTQAEISDEVGEMAEDDNRKYYLDKGASASNPESDITRSFQKFAAPIEWGGKRYRDKTDDFLDQNTKFGEKFAIDAYDWGLDIYENGDVEVYILGFTLIGQAIMKVFNDDLRFAILSIVLVWLYTSIHLKSIFLSSFGMLQVIFIFPISLFIYKDIFQIIHYSVLQMLVIFILLGISADNFFIFNDAWTQALAFPKLTEDFDKRMAFTYRRAVSAIIITSATTAIAFLSTCFSPLMPIASFGVWAFTCVAINFALTITMFPCILSFHECYIRYKCCTSYQFYKYICCCIFAGKAKQIEKEVEEEEARKERGQVTTGPVPIQSKGSSSQRKGSTVVEKQTDYGVIERFFDEKWSIWMDKAKYPVLVIFTIWFCVNIYFTSQIQPLTETERWLPDDHYIQKTIDMAMDFNQGGNDLTVVVFLMWGVEDLNDEGTNYWDAEDVGKPNWDESFDILTLNEAKQERFIQICDIVELSELKMVGDGNVECFMKDFKAWILKTPGGVFPVPQDEFYTKFIAFSEDGSTGGGLLLRKDYLMGIGQEDEKDVIKMLRIKIKSRMSPFDVPDDLRPEWDKWEDLKDEINKGNPEGMNNMKQVSEDWAWLDTFDEFIRSAVQGMCIAIAFAFVILVISTLNIIVAIYATISVAGIIICVIGVMQLSGWEFGITESISCVILIGFSVDYVVHLAAHYCHSTYDNRFDRMRESLKQIGISIFGGAITTLLAGFALFFCVVIFYTKFAVLITSSIIYSFSWSLLFFTCLCFAFGPTGNIGNLKPPLLKLKNKCCPTKEPKVKDTKEEVKHQEDNEEVK